MDGQPPGAPPGSSAARLAEVRREMRAAAARSREATAQTCAHLRKERTEIEGAHRADPAYGAARRERRRRPDPRPP